MLSQAAGIAVPSLAIASARPIRRVKKRTRGCSQVSEPRRGFRLYHTARLSFCVTYSCCLTRSSGLHSVGITSHESLARIGSGDGELPISDEVLIHAASSDQAKCGDVKLTIAAVHGFRDI